MHGFLRSESDQNELGKESGQRYFIAAILSKIFFFIVTMLFDEGLSCDRQQLWGLYSKRAREGRSKQSAPHSNLAIDPRWCSHYGWIFQQISHFRDLKSSEDVRSMVDSQNHNELRKTWRNLGKSLDELIQAGRENPLYLTINDPRTD